MTSVMKDDRVSSLRHSPAISLHCLSTVVLFALLCPNITLFSACFGPFPNHTWFLSSLVSHWVSASRNLISHSCVKQALKPRFLNYNGNAVRDIASYDMILCSMITIYNPWVLFFLCMLPVGPVSFWVMIYSSTFWSIIGWWMSLLVSVLQCPWAI